MLGNEEEDMGRLSTPQPLDQTGHLQLIVSLFGGGPSIEFEFKEEEVTRVKIAME